MIDFEQVYNEFYSKVYNYVYYRLLNRQDAEDVTSEVFIKVMNKAWQFSSKGGAQVHFWLFTIAKNAINDYLRNKKNSKIIPLKETMADEFVYDEIAANEKRAQLKKLLASIDDRSREALALRYWADMSYDEIARQMEISEKNVSVILTRAVKKLQKLYEYNESFG